MIFPLRIPRNWQTALLAYSAGAAVLNFLVFRRLARQTDTVNRQVDQEAARLTGEGWPRLEILLPVRNEENSVEPCLEALLTQDYPAFRVVAVEDNSTDHTPALLQKLAYRYPEKLVVVKAGEPPPGWLGKPHALDRGYREVFPDTGWLLFIDSDTRLQPGGLKGAVGYAVKNRLDMLSYTPGEFKSFWHQLLLPEMGKLHVMAAMQFRLSARERAVEAASANGAFILVNRKAYDLAGGHRAVRDSLIEDAALARNFRRQGFQTFAGSASRYVVQYPEGGLPGFRQSMLKTWFTVARRNWGVLVFVVGYEALFSLLPFLLLPAALLSSQKKKRNIPLVILAAALNVYQYSYMLQYYRAPRYYALLYPLVAALNTGIMLESGVRVGLLGQVTWRNRTIKL